MGSKSRRTSNTTPVGKNNSAPVTTSTPYDSPFQTDETAQKTPSYLDGLMSKEKLQSTPDDAASGCNYVVQKGDNLSSISGGDWRSLFNLNTDVVGDNPNLIYPGQVLNTCSPADRDQMAADQLAAAEAKKAADEAAAKKAAEEAKKAQLAADRAAAEASFAALDDAMGIGAFNLTEAGDAKKLLAGKTPQQMAQIRAVYLEKTGRKLESDIKAQFGGTDQNDMMGNVLNGMSIRDKINHYETGKSMQNLLDQASPDEMKALRNDPTVLEELKGKMSEDEYLDARMKLFPADAKSAVLERIKAADGYIDDDEGAAMAAFAKLGLDDRKKLLESNPDMINFLSASEKKLFRSMATSEAEALKARMEVATSGAGTDDDAMKGIVADMARLNAEEKALLLKQNDGPLSEKDTKRLKELGSINGLLQRNADGSFKSGSFFDSLSGDVKDAELHAKMEEMGVPAVEVAKQTIIDSIGVINDDEKGIREAFAKVPVDQRKALFADASVTKALTHLNDEEKTQVEFFRDNNVLEMTKVRVEDSIGWMADDEAGILKAVMELNEADRTAYQNDTKEDKGGYKAAKKVLSEAERRALNEVLDTGHLSLATGMKAASDGLGTNIELMALTSGSITPEEKVQVRRGYVLSQLGGVPANKEDAAALALYQRTKATMDGEVSGDTKQEQLDALLAHTTAKEDVYKGPSDTPSPKEPSASKDLEHSTAAGRMTAAQLINFRADDKMAGDPGVSNLILSAAGLTPGLEFASVLGWASREAGAGRGGGGLASWFSDTDETAVQSHQTQKAEFNKITLDGSVSETEIAGHEKKGETFDADYKSMLAAQNEITNTAATVATTIAGVVVTALSAGAAGPGVVAALEGLQGMLISGSTMAATKIIVKEAMGGDRYGESDMAVDAVMSMIEAGASLGVGKYGIGDKVESGALGLLTKNPKMSKFFAEFAKESTNSMSESLVGTVTENLADKKFYEGTAAEAFEKSVKDGGNSFLDAGHLYNPLLNIGASTYGKGRLEEINLDNALNPDFKKKAAKSEFDLSLSPEQAQYNYNAEKAGVNTKGMNANSIEGVSEAINSLTYGDPTEAPIWLSATDLSTKRQQEILRLLNTKGSE